MLIEVTDTHRAAFRSGLVKWYRTDHRALPWRETDDPYRIWLSEVMLQQTRVEQAAPYYRRFLERFPSVHDLADADLHDVLLCWEGLGYYSRARHLHQAARKVVEDYDGEVPNTLEEIRKLPGVGPYTAAAVLSIAYERPHAALDGNVTRVLTRVFAFDGDVKRSSSRRELQRAADSLVDVTDPGGFNQAVMELGARVCTPRSPDCHRCPLHLVCAAYRDGAATLYPKSSGRASIPHHNVSVAIIYNADGQMLIQKRPVETMLGGLWEFPGGKCRDGETPRMCCIREIREELGVDIVTDSFYHRLVHAYSHFRITLHAFRCRIVRGTPHSQVGEPLEWVRVEELDDFPFPRANRRLIDRLRAESASEGFTE